MSTAKILALVCFAVILAFIIGCSGGGGNPVTPDNDKTVGTLDSIPIIALTDTGDVFNAIGLMGVYELAINPEEMTADLVSKRISSIGEDYIVSGIAFFTIAPCPDCLKLTGISLVGGVAVLSFNIAHPFDEGNTSLPPTASNRLDLDVFDLAAVIAPGGATATVYSLTGADVYDQFCDGQDGFTTELAQVIGSESAALPFFLVIDDNEAATDTFNRFGMGLSADFDIGFNLSTGILNFDIYLTMGYGFGARRPDRLHPKYYNPEFNRKAAWKVAVTPPEGEDPPAIGNTWLDNEDTTTHNVTVEVYDWQIGAVVSTDADFADADTDEIYAASEPSNVSVEVLGMNITLPEVTVPDDPAATGAPDDPWVFTVPVANENLLAEGEYTGLVKVTDERPVLAPADGRDFVIDSPDGVELIHYSMPEYATYQTFTATVLVGNLPPNCDFGLADTEISIGDTTLCTPGTMSDPDGSIASYEWDMDYDGTTFNADVTQISTDPNFGDPFNLGPFCSAAFEDSLHDVALRVSDNGVPPMIAICTQEINVLTIEPGDLIADTVNRGEGSADAELITSITLNWTEVPCVAEYVIEKANSTLNPTSWSAVATCTLNTFNYQVGTAQMETTHRVRVYGRLVVGDDAVVTPYSEHVAMVFASRYIQGTRMLERTRELVGASGDPSLASGGFYTSTGLYNVDGWPTDHLYTYACFTNPVNENNFTNRWGMHYREFPDLEGQSVAYVDCYVSSTSDRTWVTDGGWCFGTIGTVVPEIDTGIPTVDDFLPTNDARGSLYTYETPNIGGFLTEFGDAGQAGFNTIGSGDAFEHTSYFLNDLLNEDRDFFVIAYAVGNTNPSTIVPQADYHCVALTDAIAIIVY
jgi:hypothetical protein